jgi:uncharacterized protein (DUF362 family)/Pyruvate/2-oxoacid:ferredoxin oxidoreductase delta subunit
MNPRSRVVLALCPDYDHEGVMKAVRMALEALEIEGSIQKETPVLLKPNLLMPAVAEKCVTTHPAVFSAVGRYFREKGCDVRFGDSPNGLFKTESVAARSGILEAANTLGIPLADFESGRDVSFPKGIQNRKFHIANGALDAGFLVNLPKMKTHGLMTFTGALKNTFGVIPGGRKAEFHIRLPDAEGMSRMLVDLNAMIPSGLVVMDAVRAMEGNGPSGGSLVDVGLLIASRDPVAVDAVACRIMGLEPSSIHVIRLAEKAGLGNAAEDRIEIVGTPLPIRKPFALPHGGGGAKVPRFLMRFAKKIIVPRPAISEEKCSRCGSCVKVCPASPKALSQERDEVPRFDYGICIRCYCCQETCPGSAISIIAPLLSRVFEKG